MNTNRAADVCAGIIAIWAIAMLGIEAGAHHQPTHSGTQEVVRHE